MLQKTKIAVIEMEKLKKMVQALQDEQAEVMRWKATGMGAIDYSKVKVMTSAQNRMEGLIVDVVDRHNKAVKNTPRIIKIIEQLRQTKHGDILKLRYVPNGRVLSWGDIARLKGVPQQRVFKWRTIALNDYYDKFLKGD